MPRRAGRIRICSRARYEERLYDYYYTSQPAWVGARRHRRRRSASPPSTPASVVSTDGKCLVVTRVKRPYSYLVPAGLFPRDVELWDRTGRVVRTLADVPMGDTIPIERRVRRTARLHLARGRTGDALSGPRRSTRATSRNKVPHRDRVVMLKAPFTGAAGGSCSRPSGGSAGCSSPRRARCS